LLDSLLQESFRADTRAMGAGQSIEKSPKTSPAKETETEESSPEKDTHSPAKETRESPSKKTQETSSKASPSSAAPANSKSPETVTNVVTPTTPPESSGDSLPNIAGLTISNETPTKVPDLEAESAGSPKVVPKVSEEDLALVEAVSKTLRDTTGGKSLEIVLSPAVKKPKSRVSPPTSPTANSQETIARKLQEAEERKQVLEQEKLQKLTAKLGKISNAQEMKEKKIAEKSELVKEKLESKLINAEENKKKHMEEVKDKISEHTAKIEKAQQALEAAIEAAKEATKAGLDEKMSKNEEKKNEQLKEMMTALTEHSDRIKNVRNNMEENMKPKAQQILEHMSKKEEAAKELLAKKEAERKLKVEESKKKGDLVRMNKEKLAAETSLTTESA